MIQYLTTDSERYSASEQVQMALEGGCGWIEFDPAVEKDESELRETLEEAITMTREAGAFFVITDNVALAKEFSVHGVHLSEASNPGGVREELGPEAVIGVSVRSAEKLRTLVGLDIDYISVAYTGDIDALRAIISDMRLINAEIPIVVSGDVSLANCNRLIESGASGLVVGTAAVRSDDPASYMSEILSAVAR